MYRSFAILSLLANFAQTQVSSDLYDKFIRYTAFSAAAYAVSCGTPPYGSSVVQHFNDNATDSQATLFKVARDKELVIAFRGTSTPKDLDTDFQFSLVDLNVPGTKCSNCKADSNYFRVTHANDRVSQIPLALLGFQHHGSEYWEKESDQNDATTTFLCGKQSTSCNAGQDFGENPINRAHLTYTSTVIGNSLSIVACGAPEF